MLPPVRRLPAATLLVLLLGCQSVGPASTTPSLAELVSGYDRDVTPYHPITASEQGLTRFDRILANDISNEYRSGMLAICTRYRDGLRRIATARLTEAERVTFDVFTFRLDGCIEALQFAWHLLPVNHVGQSWPSSFPLMGAGRGRHPFRTVANYDDFLGRIDGFVAWTDTAIANMRIGLERGITQPRVVMERLLPQLDTHIVDDARASLFYEPVRSFPAHFDEGARARLTALYVAAIESKIVPAYRRLRAFVHDEYLPRCRTTPGLSALPDGASWYAHAVRMATTTRLTPDEIHEIGTREVARIRAEIRTVRQAIEAAGEPAPPRYRTVEALLAGYAAVRAEVDAAVPRLFGRHPRASFEIRPIEAFRERSMPSSYVAATPDGSRPGVFYLNAGDVRGASGAAVYRNLYLHEAIPGHHFQLALQRENRGLPGFRRFGWYTAFGEGWALYAESLGVDLGVYPSRWDRLGMLQGELFRAQRLVVDTGLHAREWSRERAIAYLGGPSDNNVREVERYMAWPGQALGYKIGQLRIQALRRKAEAALGHAFDVRAFHDELLADGAMPLDALEAKMDRWLAAQRR